jgi:hypothetical protein
MTFENNNIVDVAGMCSVFKALKSFDKLESLNFRCNKNFNDDVVRALCEGIQLKKELRVSIFLHLLSNFLFLLSRPLIWVKMIFPTLEFSCLEKP